MKELLEGKRHISINDAGSLVLLDTCFIIQCAGRHDKLMEMEGIKNMAVTSFNIEELMHVEMRLPHEERHGLREFIKSTEFVILDIPVHPGHKDSETAFVSSIKPGLLKDVPDPSDAVLMAAAIKTHSAVLTKDKHHLFTVVLENFVQKHGIKVFKDLHSLTAG